MNDSKEIELAFTILNRNSVENHRLFHGTQSTDDRLLSTYYDTPSHALGQSGWTVRLRSKGDRWFQTVKGPRVLATAPEAEIEIDDRFGRNKTLHIDHLRETPVWSILNGNTSMLKPIFQTEVDRTTRNLCTKTATIESAIDQGSVYDMDRSARISINDFEIEKKSGDIGALFRVAIELTIDAEIRIENASKAQRGYQLIRGEGPKVYRPDEIILTKDATTLHGFQQIVINIVTHLRRNLNAAYVGNPEGIHQIRVAIRRMRAALTLFNGILRDETVQTFDSELRYFGQVFGEARDWDVFINETLATASESLPDANWIDLIRHVAIKRQMDAHIAAMRGIDSRRFNSLIIGMMGWIENHPALPHADRAVRSILPKLLDTVASKVEIRRKKLIDKPESLHALRKSIKRLRYAAEFIGSLYSHKAVKAFVGPCKDIQEELGHVNDYNTTLHLMRKLNDGNPAIAPAIEELSIWLNQRKLRKAFPKMLRHLRNDKPFWA